MGSSDDSVHAFKGGMMAVIFLSGLMGGFFPSVFNQHKKALSYLNCFSGGVILSAGLMHMLSEGNETLESESSFPWAFFIAGCSSLVLFSIEVIAKVILVMKTKEEVQEHHDFHGSSDRLSRLSRLSQVSERLSRDSAYRMSDVRSISVVWEENNVEENKEGKLVMILIWIALSLHSIFAGLALGVEDGADWGLSFAILAHKMIASSALGSTCVRSNEDYKPGWFTPESKLIYSFSLMTPLGIAVGWIISNSASDVVEGIFMVISAGMFINLSLTHILLEEFGEEDHDHFYPLEGGSEGNKGLAHLDTLGTLGKLEEGEDEDNDDDDNEERSEQEPVGVGSSNHGKKGSTAFSFTEKRGEEGLYHAKLDEHHHESDSDFLSHTCFKLFFAFVGFIAMSMLVLAESD